MDLYEVKLQAKIPQKKVFVDLKGCGIVEIRSQKFLALMSNANFEVL